MVASVTRNVTTLLNRSSPSHINGPNVYRPCFSSNGVPVSPNRTAFTGRFSFSRISPLSSCHSVRFQNHLIVKTKLNQKKFDYYLYSFHTNRFDLHRNYTIWLDRYSCLECHIHIFLNRANHQPNNPYDDYFVISTMNTDGMFAHRMVN